MTSPFESTRIAAINLHRKGPDMIMKPMDVDQDDCWSAVVARDVTADGRFYYAVLRPGIYCRPSCPSRLPLRKNVSFHATPEAAEAAGFRACLRCRPRAAAGTDPAAAVVITLARYIETHADQTLPLSALAKRAGYSPWHFQRAFTAVMMAATERGIAFVEFGEDEAMLRTRIAEEFPKARLEPAVASSALDAWIEALDHHLSAGGPRPELPLDLRGTAFQIRVWHFLLSVAEGDVVSYAEVARGIGEPNAVRAAATACAANRVAVLVPCHRVLRSDGGIGGYRWGIERKRALLASERCG